MHTIGTTRSWYPKSVSGPKGCIGAVLPSLNITKGSDCRKRVRMCASPCNPPTPCTYIGGQRAVAAVISHVRSVRPGGSNYIVISIDLWIMLPSTRMDRRKVRSSNHSFWFSIYRRISYYGTYIGCTKYKDVCTELVYLHGR